LESEIRSIIEIRYDPCEREWSLVDCKDERREGAFSFQNNLI
jgi:hypothetical protein